MSAFCILLSFRIMAAHGQRLASEAAPGSMPRLLFLEPQNRWKTGTTYKPHLRWSARAGKTSADLVDGPCIVIAGDDEVGAAVHDSACGGHAQLHAIHADCLERHGPVTL